MLISSEKKDILVLDLQKAPFISVYDQTQNFAENPKTGQMEEIPFKKMELVFFNDRNYKNKLSQKYKQFKDEVNSNRLLSGINLELYISETINEFVHLQSLFGIISIDEKQLLWRNDCKVYYDAKYPQDESIKKLQIFPSLTLQKISDYFIFQKHIINDSVTYLNSFLPRPEKGKYGTTYQYNYFQFEDLNNLGDDERVQQLKNDFYNDLVENDLVLDEDKRALINFFHNFSHRTKIRWLGTREELNFFISQLEERKIIKDLKRMRSEIIAKVFCDSDGNEYAKEEFHGLHQPANYRKINRILSTLTPAPNSHTH